MATLAYWNSRGLAQPIRYLLEYIKVDYKDKVYDGQGEDWFNKDKKELKTNFPNLPYFIDGETVVTESSAIPMYIIKKHKRFELLGSNPDGSFSENEIKVLQIIEVVRDFRVQTTQELMKPTFNDDKEKLYTEKFTIFLEKIRKQLGDQQFLAGSLTYADFTFYEVLSFFQKLFPQATMFDEYQKRFENIPQIKEYFQSNRFIKNHIPQKAQHVFNF